MTDELHLYEELLTRWIAASRNYRTGGIDEPEMPGEPGTILRYMATMTRERTIREMNRTT